MPLPSGLPERVADEEDVARFLTSSGHYNATAVRPAAFMPNPSNGETSVFRHGGEPLAALRAMGEAEVGVSRRVHGAAIVRAGVTRSVGLAIRAGEPPPRHADIVGWPGAAQDPDFGAEGTRRADRAKSRSADLVLNTERMPESFSPPGRCGNFCQNFRAFPRGVGWSG